MTYIRKTRDEWRVEGWWGYGWEEETAEDTLREALARLHEYRENQPEAPHRLRCVRVRIES